MTLQSDLMRGRWLTMALTSRIRTIGKVSGVAATTAPYVRRLATDDELRGDVTEFVRSANNLATHLRSDKRLRRDVFNLIASAQSGAARARADVRPRHYLRNLSFGTGLIMIGMAGAIALGWPRARQNVTRVAGQTASRANATVHDIRERIAGQGAEQARRLTDDAEGGPGDQRRNRSAQRDPRPPRPADRAARRPRGGSGLRGPAAFASA